MNLHLACVFVVITIVSGRNFVSVNILRVSSEEDESVILDEFIAELQRYQKEERSCFDEFDERLSIIWEEELNAVKVDDLGSIPTTFSFGNPKNLMYNDRFQEWFSEMDYLPDGLTSCGSLIIVFSVSQRFGYNNIICARDLILSLFDNVEIVASYTAEMLAQGDLPFKKLLTLNELNLVVFQNRSIDNMTEVEANTYQDMMRYLSHEGDDRDKMVWNLRQSCDWEDLRSIKEAKDDEKLANSVKNIVVKSHDRKLAHDLFTNVDVSAAISRERIEAWLNSTTVMKTAIDILKPVEKDPRSLCEYASDLGRRFASEQSEILLGRRDRSNFLELRGYHAVNRAVSIRDHLKKVGDPRTGHFEELADRLEKDYYCWWSTMLVLLNQHRYEIVVSFINTEISYPEIFCGSGPVYDQHLTPQYCKCDTHICRQHLIAQLFEEKYEIAKNETSGIYKIVHE